jgi:hypothetical protein
VMGHDCAACGVFRLGRSIQRRLRE